MPRVAAPFAERARACPSGLPQMPASCRCGRAHTCAPSCTATCRARSRLHGTWPSLGEKRGWMDGQDGVGQQVATQVACVLQREVEKAGVGARAVFAAPASLLCCNSVPLNTPPARPARGLSARVCCRIGSLCLLTCLAPLAAATCSPTQRWRPEVSPEAAAAAAARPQRKQAGHGGQQQPKQKQRPAA